MTDSTKVVSFYSYKGGSGRTLITANFASRLAERIQDDEKILVIDLDLQSAGLTFLLNSFYENLHGEGFTNSRTGDPDEEEAKVKIGKLITKKLEMFEAKEMIEEKEGIVDVSEPLGVREDSIHLLPSEQIGDEERPTKSKYRNNLSEFINLYLENIYDYILLDSASGRQFTAVESFDASDLAITLLRITIQFQEGTMGSIKQYLRNDYNNAPDKFLVLPNAVPHIENFPEDERKKVKLRKNKVIKECRNEISNSNGDDIQSVIEAENLETSVEVDDDGIPEVELFKWEEKILPHYLRSEGDKLSGIMEANEEDLKREELSRRNLIKKIDQIIAENVVEDE